MANYGSPRITRELRKNGIVVNRKTVEELMKENGIAAKRRKKIKATTNSNHNLPVAENLLQRDFKASKPNQAWVGDITYGAPRPGFTGAHMIGMHYTRKEVKLNVPYSPLLQSTSPSGGDLWSTDRVT